LHATEFLQVLGRADELGEAMVVVLEVEGTIDVTMNVYDDVPFDDSTSQFSSRQKEPVQVEVSPHS
jgi:hypothetical protein